MRESSARHSRDARAPMQRRTWAIAAGGVLLSSLALAGYIHKPDARRSAQAPALGLDLGLASSQPLERIAASPSAEPARPQASAAAEPAMVDAARAPSSIPKPGAAYPQNIANRAVPRLGDKPWLISPEWRSRHERQLQAAGRGAAEVVFLGDSITEGWGAVTCFRQHFGRYTPLNLGLAGDMTQNVLWRVEHGALDGTKPKAVVLMIGVNNLGGGFSPEATADGVRATLAAVRARLPEARVLLLAILPARQEPENPLRQRIKDTNRLLAGFAEPDRVDFHDLGSVLLEVDGRLSNRLTRDFLHPNAQGFEKLSTALSPLLAAVLAPPSE